MNPQTFFDHFERLTDAPNAVARLREMILQLAVQGKLVKQDERDEPATRLLERIGAERKRLIKEKKIKEAKPLPPVLQDETPFALPEGWMWARLGHLTKASDYGTSQKASNIKDDVPVLRMNNINGGKVVCENLKYLPYSIDDLPRLYLQHNDLLFNRTNSYELVGKTGIYKGDSDKMTFASYLIRLSFFSEFLDVEFINLVMNSAYFRQYQIEPNITQQTGQANFNGTKLSTTLIPIPPFEEQKRVVAKVDELMLLCDELENYLVIREKSREKLLRVAIQDVVRA
jgi:type I restriction enzyme S subunit